MLRDFSRSSMWAMAVLITAAGWSAGCRSAAPKQETPVAQPPAFQPSSRPAEKVDESKGFKEATPSIDTLPASPSSRAELLNAQGVLKPVYFDFDKSDLRPDALRTLGADVARIKQESTLKVLIEGYCDERGTVEYNLALGDRRARAARAFLASQGVTEARLNTISYGKEKPLDPGHNEAAWAKNRRDELIFVAN
jgi:peptidoglycan-associated lipoprotein